MSHYVSVFLGALISMKIMIILFIGKILSVPFLCDRNGTIAQNVCTCQKGENREKCLSCLTKCSDNKKHFLHWFRALKHPRHPWTTNKKTISLRALHIFIIFHLWVEVNWWKTVTSSGLLVVQSRGFDVAYPIVLGDPVKGIPLRSIEFHGPADP